MEERESLEQRTGFAGSITEYVDVMVEQVRQQVGDKRVLCALSGGVDSSVCAAIVHKAVGDQLVCVFVDHGLMRAGEPEMVDQLFGDHFLLTLGTLTETSDAAAHSQTTQWTENTRTEIGSQILADGSVSLIAGADLAAAVDWILIDE